MIILEPQTTIRIFKKHKRTWKKYCKIKNVPSAELMEQILKAIENKVRFYEYAKNLTTIDHYEPHLSGCKIDKNRDCIQKTVTTYA